MCFERHTVLSLDSNYVLHMWQWSHIGKTRGSAAYRPEAGAVAAASAAVTSSPAAGHRHQRTHANSHTYMPTRTTKCKDNNDSRQTF